MDELTGNFQTDLSVLQSLDDESLIQLCQTNKYTQSLCNDEFWTLRIENKFSPSLVLSPKDQYFILSSYLNSDGQFDQSSLKQGICSDNIKLVNYLYRIGIGDPGWIVNTINRKYYSYPIDRMVNWMLDIPDLNREADEFILAEIYESAKRHWHPQLILRLIDLDPDGRIEFKRLEDIFDMAILKHDYSTIKAIYQVDKGFSSGNLAWRLVRDIPTDFSEYLIDKMFPNENLDWESFKEIRYKFIQNLIDDGLIVKPAHIYDNHIGHQLAEKLEQKGFVVPQEEPQPVQIPFLLGHPTEIIGQTPITQSPAMQLPTNMTQPPTHMNQSYNPPDQPP